MKIETKTIYRCEHCNKIYLRKHACEKHEIMCSKNPKNYRPCFDCQHLGKRNIDVFLGNHFDGSESYKNVDLLFCKEKNTFLYTPKNEIKENWYDLGDETNEPMPKKCDKFKPYDIFDD
ncbi:MAG: hypothetical protein GXO49_04685 [Chlorobi bacterium]|nr:hypothetical protein [Chlorobiota bacterium]